MNWPSGTPKVAYYRLEAEDGVCEGSASVVETYNSSGGKKVSRLRQTGDQVVFTVNAKEAGAYRLYLGAAAGEDNAGLAVKVNDGKFIDRAVLKFNANYTDRIVADNWEGYEVETVLKQGENTITVSGNEPMRPADLDYIEWHPCVKEGHSWKTVSVIKEASCKESGIEERMCTVCEMTEEMEIPALEHARTEIRNAKAATCTVDGYTGDTYCKDCGDKLGTGKKIAALGHKWDNGKVTKAATATANGVKTYTCTVCGAKKTEAIPASGSLAAGTKLTSGSGKYQVAKNKTVVYTGAAKKTKTVKIPATIRVKGVTYKVTAIGANAFKGNKTVTKVTMGSNIKTIGKNAFYGCTKLKSVTIGKNVDTIGVQAFANCTSLTAITIPAKVNKIGAKAFYKSKKLKKVAVKTTKLTTKKVGKLAFKGIYAKASIKVPKSKLKTYKKLLKARGISSKAKVAVK